MAETKTKFKKRTKQGKIIRTKHNRKRENSRDNSKGNDRRTIAKKQQNMEEK